MAQVTLPTENGSTETYILGDSKEFEVANAGTMPSSNGSASVACIPFRNVRLGSAFFVMIMSSSSSETVRS